MKVWIGCVDGKGGVRLCWGVHCFTGADTFSHLSSLKATMISPTSFTPPPGLPPGRLDVPASRSRPRPSSRLGGGGTRLQGRASGEGMAVWFVVVVGGGRVGVWFVIWAGTY